MTNTATCLHVLLIEDDKENLGLLMSTLPNSLCNYLIQWEPCDSFQDAEDRIKVHRYDIIVTDIYIDRKDRMKGQVEDEKAGDIVNRIRGSRFCPLVVFTDGSAPQSIRIGPFVKFADKTRGNSDIIAKIEELIQTGIPGIARKLHDELDRLEGSYLWDFLEGNWDSLKNNEIMESTILERIIRRRAAMQLGRLNPAADEPREIDVIEGAEFYIYPGISKSIRLGEILICKKDNSFRIVVTPHCHLEIQPNETHPRAEYVLTIKAFPAVDIIAKAHGDENGRQRDPWVGNAQKKIDALRRRIQSPADSMGKPKGRYWYLPSFLKIPDLYCDFLQVESIPFGTVTNATEYERIAVLDTPFAEAFQSCFTRFYAAIGIANLNPEKFKHLMQGDSVSGK
jgi:CheY-like chemotaxis protein